MKSIFYIFVLLCFANALHAQSASEVLKYSLSRPFGTARSTGCSNAMGALGGDFTAISINPGGIGLYRKSDFYISTYVNFDEQQSTLSGGTNTTYSETKDRFGLSGLGFVFTTSPIASKWKNASFVINFMKTADFNKSTYFKGRSVGSITDRFLELSLDPQQTGFIGLKPNQLDDFEAGLAYETNAVYNVSKDSTQYVYTTDLIRHPNYQLPKEQLLKTTGGLYNLSFGIGGNYDEILAIGASIDIPFGTFRSVSQYHEYEAAVNEVLPFKNLDFHEELNTEISGIGGKLGVIYKPTPNIRLGLSWQTPTYLWMTDSYNTSLQYTFNEGSSDQSSTSYSPQGSFTYRLILPMRTILSGAYISSLGFISADVDFINVANSRFNLTADSDAPGDYQYQETVNADIKKQFKSAIQYRLGGELNLSYFRLRAGIEYLQQSYANSDKYDPGFSLGFGYRGNKYYLDLGYRHFTIEQAYSPYLTGNSDFDGNGTIDAPTPLVHQKNIQQMIQLTFGVKM
jgi:hypothetical protein